MVVKAVFTSGHPLEYQVSSEPAAYEVVLLRDGEETPVSGYAAALPQDIMDALAKSAAWPGSNVDALDYAFRIVTLPANSETHDYYAYRLDDGTAVLQGGGDQTILDPARRAAGAGSRSDAGWNSTAWTEPSPQQFSASMPTTSWKAASSPRNPTWLWH